MGETQVETRRSFIWELMERLYTHKSGTEEVSIRMIDKKSINKKSGGHEAEDRETKTEAETDMLNEWFRVQHSGWP